MRYMSGINRRRSGVVITGLFLMSMLLAGCGTKQGEEEKEVLLMTSAQTEEESIYETTMVTRGDFIRSTNFDGVLFYPETEPVIYEGEQAVLQEWLVRAGDRVAEGDPLASIRVEYDEVALAEMELTLERMRSDYDWQKKQMEAEVAAGKAAWEQDGSRKSELIYQKAEKSLELYELSMEQGIRVQEENIRLFRERIAVTEIVAPADGVVENLPHIKSGEYVPQGQTLMEIYNPDIQWLRVTDVNASLRYNMEVRIETGQPKRRTVLTGRVVAADNILQDSLRRGVAYIEIDEVPEETQWTNTSIKADVVSAEQVLLVDRLAVETIDGSSFVYLLEDGDIYRRQVIRAGQGPNEVWVLMGLEEGQEVVIIQ